MGLMTCWLRTPALKACLAKSEADVVLGFPAAVDGEKEVGEGEGRYVVERRAAAEGAEFGHGRDGEALEPQEGGGEEGLV